MEKKVAVITGSARGLGRAGAERFLSSGNWKVALLDVNEAMLAAAAKELGEKYGAENVAPFTVNITSKESVDATMKAVIEKFGRIDTLVNNAGITRDAMMHKMQEPDWDLVLDVNLKGAFLCAQAVAMHMKERKSGSIVNTSSVVGVYGNMGRLQVRHNRPDQDLGQGNGQGRHTGQRCCPRLHHDRDAPDRAGEDPDRHLRQDPA
jgi:3-oxoacyl-[acyl-carrier protein] reductase